MRRISYLKIIQLDSYDLNTSRIGRTQGVHELSLTWQSNHACSQCDNYKVKLKRNGESGYQKM